MRQTAHDLANLLTVANGHRQESEKYLEKALDHSRQARKADELMMELCRSMLTGNLSPTPAVFDLNLVVKQLVPLGVGTDHFDGPIFVTGSRLVIYRALLNLCVNAQNAGADRIVATTRVRDGHAVVAIRDNGCGMPADMVANLWNLPMSDDQLHGHGLRIVKRTVESLGGTIDVESNAGRGTTFSISLPLSEAGTLAA
jgi:two-component system, cell cycle sensor histidine kinase and response regulator CckA